MTSNEVAVTPSQSRAARALLAWTQPELAKRAKVGASTVADFERGQRTPVPNNAEAMRSAFEAAGVSFLPGGVVIGPKPRSSSKGRDGGSPARWIDGTDLVQWADRRDSHGGLPELLTRLTRASVGTAAALLFRAGEGVHFPGWDGTCETPQGSQYVPSGSSAWEVSAQREGITSKATEDFDKRTKNPVDIDPASATFVFVTPRRWSEKAQWIQDRRTDGKWLDVRAYDADDLVHWIELCPAVGQWLAVRIGKRPAGLQQLDEVWEEWSLSTRWPLSSELVRAGRDEEQSRVLRWIRDEPAVLAVQGDSTEEVIAFLCATIRELPAEYQLAYESQCLVAHSKEAARSLADSLSPLVVVLVDIDSGVAQRLVQDGHHVYIACGPENAFAGTPVKLPRPPRMFIESELRTIGLESEAAAQLARDCSGNLAVLRRLISPAPARLPRWVSEDPDRALLSALLASSWDDSSPGDRLILERLSGLSYGTLAGKLAPWVGAPDSPMRKAGSVWKITSARDAWLLLAGRLTDEDFNRLMQVAVEIFSAIDPRFQLSRDERWRDATRPKYSGPLREGIASTLVLFAVFARYAPCVSNPASQINTLISNILTGADRERWWSISGDFQLLAEAAPEGFLRAVEDALSPTAPAIAVLFEEDGGPFGAEHMSNLLWALEMLAWDPVYLGHAVTVLARLAHLDPGGGRYANRPRNSLRQTFLLWFPQTHATLEQRLQVLDALAQKRNHPDVAWRLMLDVFPKYHDSSNHAPKPRWREFAVDQEEVVDTNIIVKGADALSERLLKLVGANPERWIELIEVLPKFSLGRREQACKLALNVAAEIKDDAARAKIAAALRQILHNHRQLPDADWALPTETLDQLERIYEAVQPVDLVSRNGWLFVSHVLLPRPTVKNPDGPHTEFETSYKSDQSEAAAQRRSVVEQILLQQCAEGIFALITAVEAPGLVGVALAELPQSDEVGNIIRQALVSDRRSEQLVGQCYVDTQSRSHGQAWSDGFLSRAKGEEWGLEAMVRTLVSLPNSRITWERAEVAGDDTRDLYWKECNPFWTEGDIADVQFAAAQLKNAGRARHAIDMIGHGHYRAIASDVLEDLLATAAAEPWLGPQAKLNVGMFQHYIAEILKELEGRGDLSFEKIARLEWAYFPLLEHWPKAPRTLHKLLATSPSFFMDLIKAIYRPADGSGVQEDVPTDAERATNVARQAFSVLQSWRHPPGLLADGTLEAKELQGWISVAREQAALVGRAAVVESHIGQVLAHAPADPDGIWPATCVREVIESSHSRELENGLVIGAQNKRGVTTRGMTDGGSQERDLAANYRRWAKTTALEWHRTSAALARIAGSYDELGQWHDHRAERVEW
jgi:transcriptional regulator with XRE-family HTH domain